MRTIQIWLGIATFGLAGAAPLSAANTTARLFLESESTTPGSTVLAGIELDMNSGWHTYWRNPGDSGKATEIQWTLPEGITAGEILWPVPEVHEADGMVTYVYKNRVVLLIPLTISPELQPGSYTLQANVFWLECETLCVPGDAKVEAQLQVGTRSQPSEHAETIAAWKSKLPGLIAPFPVQARWESPAPEESDTRTLILQFGEVPQNTNVDFFPYENTNFQITAAEKSPASANNETSGSRKKVTLWENGWPERIQGIVVSQSSDSADRQAAEVTVTIASASESSATSPTPPQGPGLVWMLWFAFLGGLILNIMPCVLPVISLKILGFVQQSQEAPQRVRRLGMVYCAGVLASFLVLAGMVIGVQSAGHLANWGMQFQNPQFLVLMMILVLLVALNFFGVFEVTLGGKAIGAASNLAGKEGHGGAFFNGVLATTLATPCTAPFLAPALGFAFSQTPVMIVLFFETIGLGLAFPYLLLSWNPAWLRFLPKPGPWMVTFKTVMGFPLLATAVWLYSIALSHFGRNAAWLLGLLLVIISLSAWLWGHYAQRRPAHKWLGMAFSLALAGLAAYWILEGEIQWRSNHQPNLASQTRNPQTQTDGIPWQSWSPEAVQQARQAGHPVLVDFTAQWCATCQANKRTSLEISAVEDKVRELNVRTFLGDYTHSNPEITRELRKFGRAGVPLVLVYPPSLEHDPLVLPELLTPSVVLESLEKATRM